MGDLSDGDGGRSGDKSKKNGDNHTNTVDYWTRAMVQNMKEEALLDRRISKIEKEHSQVIIQMTYTHRQLTDRLKLVNWYHKKKKERERERERDWQVSESSSSGSSHNSLDFRDFKTELREYWEWKERVEMRRGKKNKPTLEPELRERMKLEMNALRRPQPPVLPPLIKPSFMYRQWKRKNKKILKANPKYLLEKKKMYLMAEDAEEQQRQASNNSKEHGYAKYGQLKRQATNTSLIFNNQNSKEKFPKLADSHSGDSENEADGKPRTALAKGSFRPGGMHVVSSHKTAALFKPGGKGNVQHIPRPASSTEVETVAVLPLHATKGKNQTLPAMTRSTTSII